ncbi:MAG: arsenate reductase (glutaredoxin) [Magnetococcales bacterium]|nr:arsenate reductase (glutaredoxin) [Magnetococcales bacterium]
MDQSASLVIWHNPRCSKSRAALKLLEDQGLHPQVQLYLESPPSAEELERTLDALQLEPHQLLRTSEPLCKELGLNLTLPGRSELIALMVAHPRLIERPVVISGDRAVLGRPPENVLELLR